MVSTRTAKLSRKPPARGMMTPAKKCTEERMDFDKLGAEGRHQDYRQDDCKGALVWLRAIEFRRA